MGADDAPLSSGRVEIDHLSFAYRGPSGSPDITLDIPSRSFVALVGHTGSGKSTLASLMMGYYPLTHGEIRIDGRPLASLSHSALRRGIAMVQQDPVVLADTFTPTSRWAGTSVRRRFGKRWRRCSWRRWRAA
nr:Multidrug resistance-like ATP-binding protein MdlB [Klebsiella pneumoniae]